MCESNPANSPAPPPVPVSASAPQPPPLVTKPGVSEEDKSLGMPCHLLGIFTGILGPLILWLVKKDASPFVGHHGREALNFQITVLLVMLCLGTTTFILMFVFIGIVLIPFLFIVPILALVAGILAAVAAQKGEWHRYPCCMRMV